MLTQKRGQIFSLEIIVTITLFVVIFVVVVALISFTNRPQYKSLQEETVFLTSAVTQDQRYQLIRRGQIDVDKYAQLAQENYSQLKQDLGLRSDFCIFIEDQNGNAINITINGRNYSQIGNGSSIMIGGKACGT